MELWCCSEIDHLNELFNCYGLKIMCFVLLCYMTFALIASDSLINLQQMKNLKKKGLAINYI